VLIYQDYVLKRCIHTSTVLNKTQAGRYRPKIKLSQALTYEMANGPHHIADRKSWNSWNTSNIKDGNRPAETAIEDIFIRNFINGTWYGLFASEIIIKRQHNIIRIVGLIYRKVYPNKIYFLIGFTEELLSFWLHCPVKINIFLYYNKMF
ncbi:28S ribosomal protein S24, mitochondrial, partial [Eufriesea mexicana]